MFKYMNARRVAVLALAVLVPCFSLISAPANATTPPVIGAASLSPATGKASDPVNFDTHTQCPSDASKFKVQLWTTGANPTLVGNVTGTTALTTTAPNAYGGFSSAFAQDMATTLVNDSITAPNGVYQVRVDCTDGSGFNVLAIMEGNVQIVHAATDNAGDGTYTYQPGALAAPTTTTLTTSSTSVTYPGKFTATATLSPTNAAGKIQFKRGTTNVGSPVALSASGTASLSVALTPATYSMSAVFVPNDPEAFKSSTSNMISVVVKPGTFKVLTRPSIYGTMAVGHKLICRVGSWSPKPSSYTYVWKRSGRYIISRRSYYVPVRADRYHYLTCTVTAHRSYYSALSSTSPSRKVA